MKIDLKSTEQFNKLAATSKLSTALAKNQCPFCLRCTHLTFHHFIPRKVHRRNYFKKNFRKHQLQAGVRICRSCHSAIHKFYNEMELAKNLNSAARLLADPKLAAHFRWIAKQKLA